MCGFITVRNTAIASRANGPSSIGGLSTGVVRAGDAAVSGLGPAERRVIPRAGRTLAQCLRLGDTTGSPVKSFVLTNGVPVKAMVASRP